MKAIFHFKYLRFSENMNKYKKPVIKMQALLRGKFVRRVFILMKASAIIIQRAFRRHLRKKYYLIRLWKKYRKTIYDEKKSNIRELCKLNANYPETSNIRPDTKFYP